MSLIAGLALPALPASLAAAFASPFVRALGIVLAVLVAVMFIYGKGHSAATAKCDTASLRAELRIVKADLSAAQRAAADALAKAGEISESERKLKEKQSDLESELAKRPPAGACIISPADARRLR